MSQLKCPSCGGQPLNQIGQNTYSCPYCGQMFTYNQQASYGNTGSFNPSIQIAKKNRTVAAILAIFLGIFGVHCFYMGKTFKGILYLMFFWTYIPAIIGFIEGILYLTKTDEEFALKCN